MRASRACAGERRAGSEWAAGKAGEGVDLRMPATTSSITDFLVGFIAVMTTSVRVGQGTGGAGG